MKYFDVSFVRDGRGQANILVGSDDVSREDAKNFFVKKFPQKEFVGIREINEFEYQSNLKKGKPTISIELSNKEIKYKYLLAWDTMMGSSQGWKEMMQEKAAKENAPEDAIYRDNDGRWHRFCECESEETKKRVQGIVDRMESNPTIKRKTR